MDVLSDVLAGLRLRGTVYFSAEFRAPWGLDIAGGEVANFHLLREGGAWVSWRDREGATRSPRGLSAVYRDPLGDQASVALAAGDLIVFPHGHRHALRHSPDGAVAPAAEVLEGVPIGQGKPVKIGGDGPATTLICGHFTFDRALGHPLLRSLPDAIVLRRSDPSEGKPEPRWVHAVAALSAAEDGLPGPGHRAVVDRLAEALLVHVLRAHLAALPAPAGFFAALAEPVVRQALELLHSRPEHPWRVEDLAREVGASRSVLAQRFRETVGRAPFDYLTDWRMQRAAELLRHPGGHSVAQVAGEVGYASEWAFAKAFKRRFGVGPGSWRRTARKSA